MTEPAVSGDLSVAEAAALLARRRHGQAQERVLGREAATTEASDLPAEPAEAVEPGPDIEPEAAPVEVTDAETEAVAEPEAVEERLIELSTGQQVSESELAEWQEAAERRAEYDRGLQAQAEASERMVKMEEALNRDAFVFRQRLAGEMDSARRQLATFEAMNWEGLSQEEYSRQKAAQDRARDRVTDLQNQMGQFAQEYDRIRQANLAERAKLHLPQIRERIEGWDDALYAKLTEHAVTRGLPRELVNQITEPAFWDLVNDAMAWREGSKIAQSKAVRRAPSKSLKAGSPTGGAQARSDKAEREAMQRLTKARGTRSQMEAAVAALEARRSRR